MRYRLNRITPVLDPYQYSTYRVLSPQRTHYRDATCPEVDCPNYLHGWATTIDTTTDRGQSQAYYIRHESGRRSVEECTAPGVVRFVFEPGQMCFGAHYAPVGRPPLYLVQRGDWRVPLETERVHKHAEDWADDCQNQTDLLITRLQRG
jgi:hypothetical protein